MSGRHKVVGAALLLAGLAMLAPLAMSDGGADQRIAPSHPAADSTGNGDTRLGLVAQLQFTLLGEKVSVSADETPATVPASALPDGVRPDIHQEVAQEARTPDGTAGADALVGVTAASASDEGRAEVTTVGAAENNAPTAVVAAGVLVTLAGLAAYFWSSVKPLLLKGAAAILPFPLFSRIEREEVLENEVRRTIYEAVKTDPGLSATDVSEAADVSWGTTVYHLNVLEDNHYVVSMKDGRHRRYFENGGRYNGRKEALAALQNDTTANVFDTIQEAPGLPQKEIASRVGLSPQALHWHLNRLGKAGLLRKVRDGRAVRHYIKDAPA